ncbi:AraC family transcriptional regulator ligand-binding domain-containing protein [Marinomonas sp.]|uniref:AraC family transcriptional regulator n=1 Tax=Marinomonas sp. TaxID=1904862 RepID=UPI003BAB65F4
MLGSNRSVSAMAVVDLARELYQRGIVSERDIQSVDANLFVQVQALIEQQDLSQLIERQYPEVWLVSLWHMADKRNPHSSIGVDIGATVSHKASGIINHLMQNCINLQEVLEVYLNSSSLVNPADTWQVKQANNQVSLTFSFLSDFIYPRCAIERSMISLYRWACYYTDQSLPLLSAQFTFAAPEYAQAIQKQLQCSIKYGMPDNQLVLPQSVLSISLKSNQPYLKKILQARVKKLIESNASEQPISDVVRTLLKQNLICFSSQAVTANELCMSRSTLSRKLKNEGTHFTNILNTARQQLAIENAHLPTKQIIDKLGFADESAYYKAKKKWHSSE